MIEHRSPFPGQVLGTAELGSGGYSATACVTGTPLETSNVVTSIVEGDEHRHRVVLDIDLPAVLLPSSTPGHHHLFVDCELEWSDYVELLELLAELGIVQRGYANASIARGFTAVRLPWVKKAPKVSLLKAGVAA